MLSPLLTALGYGWKCPYCLVPMDEGKRTGVYYFGEPVCSRCAKILHAARDAEEETRGPREHPAC